MSLRDACALYLLPHRLPTLWAAWLRERRVKTCVKQQNPMTAEITQQPLLNDDGRVVTVRGLPFYPLPDEDT
jgi:hypothetical protein